MIPLRLTRITASSKIISTKATASEVASRVLSGKPTILKYLDDIAVEGPLAVDAKNRSSVGRPSKIFSVNASAAFAVGVDFGAPDLVV